MSAPATRSRKPAPRRRARSRSSTTLALRRVVVPPEQRLRSGPGSSSSERPVRAARMAARRFDDDHVGAEVGEQLARPRGVLARELDDPSAPCERAAVIRPSPSVAASAISSSSRPSRSRQHLVGVLAQARAAVLDRPVGLRQVHGDAVDADVTHLGVVQRPATARTRSCPGRGRCGPRATRRPTPARQRRGSAPRWRDRSRVAVHVVDVRVERVLRREPAVERRRTAASVAHGSSITAARSRPVVVVTTRDGDPLVVAACRVDAVRRHRRRVAAVGVGLTGSAQRTAVHRVVEEVGTARATTPASVHPCRSIGPRRCGCGGSARRGWPRPCSWRPCGPCRRSPSPRAADRAGRC